LRSLVNFGKSDPSSWLKEQGFKNITYQFWSSSTYGGWHIYAWLVQMATGTTEVYKKINTNYILPVRSGASESLIPTTGQTSCWDAIYNIEIYCSGTGQDGELQKGIAWPSPRFVDNGNGTITDALTGLMWTKDANLIKSRDVSFDTDGYETDGTLKDGRVSWQHALDYINKLNSEAYLGYTDWRLPNVNELISTVYFQYDTLHGDYEDLFKKLGFTNMITFGYWSSTAHANYNSPWSISNSIFYYMNKDQWSGVWPVRGGY
jgi:hypothetical protein